MKPLVFQIIDRLLYLLVIGSILIFILWPIVQVFKESFYVDGKWDLTLYRDLFRENQRLLWNSLWVAGWSTLLTAIVAIPMATYLYFLKGAWKRTILALLLLTMISPPFISSLAYITLFGRRGWITHDLLGLTWNTYGWHGIVLMQAISYIPFATLLIYGVLQGVERKLLYASLDAGVSLRRTITQILLPLARPGIIVALLITFVKSLSDFGTPIFIGGSYNVLATEAYLQVIAQYNTAKGAAMSVLLLIPALIALLIYRYYLTRLPSGFDREISDLWESEAVLRLRGRVRLFLGGVTWSYLAIMLLQYGTILFMSVTKRRPDGIHFTLEYFQSFSLHQLDSLVRSIGYAIGAGLIASLLGILFAYYVERRQVRGGRLLDFSATFPYIIPGTFFGIGYILAFRSPPLALTGTALIVLCNYIFRQLPFTTKTASAVMKQFNPQLEHAGRDLGATHFHILTQIILPMMKPAFILSFVNTFTVTMTSLGAVIFLIYPGGKVATVDLFNSIRDGEYGAAAVMAVCIILVTLSINLIFSRLVLKGGRRSI